MIRVYRVDGLPYEPSDDYVATQAALETTLSIANDNASLRDVIAFIRDKTGVNLVVNWSALELVGIDQDILVTLTLNDVSARTLLNVALEQVSADAYDDDKAGLAIRDGIVKVSSKRDLYHGAETRLYDVAWFVDARLDVTHQLYERQYKGTQGWLQGRDKATGKHISIDAKDLENWSFFCINCSGITHEDGSHDSVSYHELIDQLISSITMTVGDPDEWGDQQSTIDYMTHRLTIKTSPENHDVILRMLKKHRRLQVDAFEAQAKAIAITLLLRDAEKRRLGRDYDEALELIDDALKVAPDHAEALVLRRIVLRTMQD